MGITDLEGWLLSVVCPGLRNIIGPAAALGCSRGTVKIGNGVCEADPQLTALAGWFCLCEIYLIFSPRCRIMYTYVPHVVLELTVA